MTPEELAVEFPLGPESLPQPGVPRGTIEKASFASSRIFPGTARDYYFYTPAQYDSSKPACLMVVQDGWDHIRSERRWQIPTVLDNLIHRGDIPVCIGLFIDPGKIPLPGAPEAVRSNRGFEYDSLSDRYPRFLAEEMLPEAERRFSLKTDPGSRLIMGGSSGGICALHAAWRRPDVFQRVFSVVGSFTGQRGGQNLSPMIRLAEPRPMRVFLEGGADDLNIFAGYWWAANVEMLACLQYTGCEVNHAFAEHAGHNDFHGSSIFPDALRWLWKDYPQPIRTGVDSKQAVMKVLVAGEGWRPVESREGAVRCVAAGSAGEVYFTSEPGGRVVKLGGDGREEILARSLEGVTDLATTPQGGLLACQPALERIVALGAGGKIVSTIEKIRAQSACPAADGGCYAADTGENVIWHVARDGKRTVADSSLAAPFCLRRTTDGNQLIACSAHGRMAHLFTLQPDGSLANGAPFYRLNLDDESTDCGTVQIAAHEQGWTCFATALGLQLGDLGGSVTGIISSPRPQPLTGVAIGGPGSSELYAACGGKLYRRKIQSPPHIWC